MSGLMRTRSALATSVSYRTKVLRATYLNADAILSMYGTMTSLTLARLGMDLDVRVGLV